MKIFSFILLFLSTVCSAQKILRSEYDKEAKKYVIETTTIQAKMDLDDILGFWVRSEDTTIYLITQGIGGGAGKINQGDELIFRLVNDSTAVASSVTFQTFEKGRIGDTYSHQYHITEDEMMKLLGAPLKSIRKYVSNRFITLEIKEKRSKLMSSLVEVFLKEYKAKKIQFIYYTRLK